MPFIYYLRTRIIKLLLLATGVRIRLLKPAQEFFPKEPVIICPNHSSWLDILLIMAISTRPTCFLGKIEIVKIPLLGWLFKKSDIPIDRSKMHSAGQMLDTVYSKMKEGYDVVIFPEGTVSEKAPELLSFKKGAFKLATDRQIPLLPVILADAWHLWPYAHFFSGRPGLMRIKILEPLLPEKTANAIEVRNRVKTTMQSELLKLFN